MINPPIKAILMADVNDPPIVFINKGILTGGMHNASPSPTLWLKLHKALYVIKLSLAGAYIMLSNIQSMKINMVMAAVSSAITDRTMCQRSTSRWSIKLISAFSPSSFPLIFLKKDFLFDVSTLNSIISC